jgi:amphi-Trp domain-containing protein
VTGVLTLLASCRALEAAASDPNSKENTVMADNERDVEVIYATADIVAKLRRLADALEQEKPFRIQIAGERIRVPARAAFSIEHERESDSEEIEFQFTWDLDPDSDEDDDDEALTQV